MGSRCFLLFLPQPCRATASTSGAPAGGGEGRGGGGGERLPRGAENLKIGRSQLPPLSPPISAEHPVTSGAHLRVVTSSHLVRQGQPAAPSSDNKGKLANRSAFEVRIAVTRRRQEEQSSTGASFPASQDGDFVFHLQTEEGVSVITPNVQHSGGPAYKAGLSENAEIFSRLGLVFTPSRRLFLKQHFFLKMLLKVESFKIAAWHGLEKRSVNADLFCKR